MFSNEDEISNPQAHHRIKSLVIFPRDGDGIGLEQRHQNIHGSRASARGVEGGVAVDVLRPRDHQRVSASRQQYPHDVHARVRTRAGDVKRVHVARPDAFGALRPRAQQGLDQLGRGIVIARYVQRRPSLYPHRLSFTRMGGNALHGRYPIMILDKAKEGA